MAELLVAAERQPTRFWAYLRAREIDWPPSPALRWWLIAVITIAWATEQFERLRLSPVLVYFLDEFHIDLRGYGLIHLAGIVASGIGTLVLGDIADRFGRRPAIVWPMVLYLPLLAGMALAPNLWVYTILVTLGSFLIMGMSAAVNAAIRDVMPRVGRAFGYAFITLAWTLGAFLTQGVAALTIPIWPGWRPQLWIGGAVALGITVFVWVCYRDVSPRARAAIAAHRSAEIPLSPDGAAARSARTAASVGGPVADGRVVYRHAHIWLLGSVQFWWGITYTTLVAYLPTFLAQWHGLEPRLAARITTAFFLLAGVSGFVSAVLSDRLGLRKLMVSIGVVVVGGAMIAVSFLPRDSSYESLLLVWSAISLFAGFLYPSWCALMSENAEDLSPNGVARAFGLSGALTTGVGVVTALVLPQIVERLGWQVWMVIAGVCAIVNVFWISFARGPWLHSPQFRPRRGAPG